jgi:hypothetical protein
MNTQVTFNLINESGGEFLIVNAKEYELIASDDNHIVLRYKVK